MTPEQLRDRFALPFLPDSVTNVLIPTGTCLLSGIAGPIVASQEVPAGFWGFGGAQQTRVIGVD